MLWQASKPTDETETDQPHRPHGLLSLAATAIATSIDATAVGVSLAFLDINIVTACLVIGGITTVVATTGVLIGRHVGSFLGRYAEVVGGLTLIGIGSLILYTHLTAG
jgi:putative Mn2+ efflux pump MntP